MRLKTLVHLSGALTALALATAATAAQPADTGKPQYGAFGVDLSAEDTSVKPGDDFWQFANGTWAKNTQIAPDRSMAGPFVTLSDRTEQQVRDILTDLAANPAEYGASGKQIGDFYASWMDTAGVEARGAAPLKPYLDRIAAVTDRAGLETLFATQDFAAPVGIGIIPDFKDPTRYTCFADQGGLGMARDNYLLEGAQYDAYRKAYRAYIEQMLTLGGIADAASKADAIMALETAMAKVQWAPERTRDMKAIYNPMDRQQMAALAPQFDWAAMMDHQGLANVPSVIMAEPSAFTDMGKMLDTVPLDTWKAWMTFHFISDHAAYLPKAFDDAHFAFYGTTLSGIPQQRDRWKRGVQLLDGALGEAIGKIYVDRYFPPESQAKMAALVDNLRAALGARLKANSWMDDATRQAALAKLAAFDPRIGHPVKYIDYSPIVVKRDDLLGNVVRANQFQWDLQVSRLGKPVDRSLWDMTPQTIDAYYNPLTNQITFPAGILQPPAFDPNADPAVNYGAIGAVIGHEMGHGFDDQGSQFGPDGAFKNWWSDAARTAFTARTAALVKQYDGYEPIPGTHIKGQLTLGENIGDLGGLQMAYEAYHRSLDGKPAPVIDGLTGDQRFFLAFAQVWRAKQREDAERQQLLSNPHSPPKYRVDGVVRNVDAWYTAFDVKPGDTMYLPPDQRVHIW